MLLCQLLEFSCSVRSLADVSAVSRIRTIIEPCSERIEVRTGRIPLAAHRPDDGGEFETHLRHRPIATSVSSVVFCRIGKSSRRVLGAAETNAALCYGMAGEGVVFGDARFKRVGKLSSDRDR